VTTAAEFNAINVSECTLLGSVPVTNVYTRLNTPTPTHKIAKTFAAEAGILTSRTASYAVPSDGRLGAQTVSARSHVRLAVSFDDINLVQTTPAHFDPSRFKADGYTANANVPDRGFVWRDIAPHIDERPKAMLCPSCTGPLPTAMVFPGIDGFTFPGSFLIKNYPDVVRWEFQMGMCSRAVASSTFDTTTLATTVIGDDGLELQTIEIQSVNVSTIVDLLNNINTTVNVVIQLTDVNHRSGGDSDEEIGYGIGAAIAAIFVLICAVLCCSWATRQRHSATYVDVPASDVGVSRTNEFIDM